MDANNFSLQEMYMQVPLVTRTWLTGVVAVTVGAHFGLVPLYNLNLSFEHIFTKLQVWRLVTSFLFLGPLDLSWLINLFMVYKLSVDYERNSYPSAGGPGSGSVADTAWTLCLGALGLLVGYGWLLGGVFPGLCLPMFIIYLYSKRNPNAKANIWGLPPGGFPALYMPFALVAFTIVLKGDPVPQLVGIAVGHLYYYIAVVLAETQGPLSQLRTLLATPHAVCRLFGTAPTDRAPPGQRLATGVPAAPHRWTGRAHTLNGGVVEAGWLQRAWEGVGSVGAAVSGAAASAWRAVAPPQRPAPGFHPVAVPAAAPRRAGAGAGGANAGSSGVGISGSSSSSSSGGSGSSAAAAAAPAAAAASPAPAPAAPAAAAAPAPAAPAPSPSAQTAEDSGAASVDDDRRKRLEALARRGIKL